MISNKAAKYLWDARHAADRVIRFVAGRTYDEYVADEMLSAAVERQFEIIGEALVRLRRTAPDVSAIIPDVSDIIGFRNVLVHDYENVDFKRVWVTIQADIPQLVLTLTELLRQAPPLE